MHTQRVTDMDTEKQDSTATLTNNDQQLVSHASLTEGEGNASGTAEHTGNN